MKNHIFIVLLFSAMMILFGCSKEEPVTNIVNAVSPIEADAEILNNISVCLPDNMTRETVSNIQHDFFQDGKQIGGIVLVDIPSDLLDSPMEGLFEIVELLRNQLMPDVPAEEAQIISWGGNQNAYMELVTGPDEMAYFHFLFRGANNVYDVWFDWELMDQNSDMIYEIVNSVTGDDILSENNQNPF